MSEKYNTDYLEGYTKAKEEDKEEIKKAYDALHTYEHEYVILKEIANKNSQYIENNEQYIDLGHALKTILDYMRDKNV